MHLKLYVLTPPHHSKHSFTEQTGLLVRSALIDLFALFSFFLSELLCGIIRIKWPTRPMQTVVYLLVSGSAMSLFRTKMKIWAAGGLFLESPITLGLSFQNKNNIARTK